MEKSARMRPPQDLCIVSKFFFSLKKFAFSERGFPSKLVMPDDRFILKPVSDAARAMASVWKYISVEAAVPYFTISAMPRSMEL